MSSATPPTNSGFPPQDRDRSVNSGFSLTELVVVIVIITLIIVVLLPALNAYRRAARSTLATPQVVGIQQGMYMFASTNNEKFPGIDPTTGQPVPASVNFTGDDEHDGSTVEGRYYILLKNGYFTGEYAISPVETGTVWTTGPVTSANYSYAFLRIDTGPGRRQEWATTTSSHAIALSDRLAKGTPGIPASYQSIHTTRPGDWRGEVGWNDNHVSFVKSPIQQTWYSRPNYSGPTKPLPDDIFFEDTAPGQTGNNAIMVYHGNDGVN